MASSFCASSPGELPAGLQQSTFFQNGFERQFLTYYPSTLPWPAPVWLLAPGSDVDPALMLEITRLRRFADLHGFAIVVLAGVNDYLNVGVAGRAQDTGEDDVAYTVSVLSLLGQHLCIDRARFVCLGASRGARFCSRLASELPAPGLAAVGAWGGLRFPRPINATQPIPMMAWHDLRDPVNPYEGGGPAYWDESMPSVFEAWARFNGCTEQHGPTAVAPAGAPSRVELQAWSGCQGRGEVVSLVTNTGSHRWTGDWAVDAFHEFVEYHAESSENASMPWWLQTGQAESQAANFQPLSLMIAVFAIFRSGR